MTSNQIAFRSYYDDTGVLVRGAVFCIEPYCSEESCWLGGRCQSCEATEEFCSLSNRYEECLGCAGPSSPGANGYCAACWTQRYGCVEEPSPCAQCGENFDVGLAIDASRCPRCILSPCCASVECNTCGCTAEFRDGERICWCDACEKDGCSYHACSGEIDYERGIKVCDNRDDSDCPQYEKSSEPVIQYDWSCPPYLQLNLRRNSVTSPPAPPTCTICGDVASVVPETGICYPCKQATRRCADCGIRPEGGYFPCFRGEDALCARCEDDRCIKEAFPLLLKEFEHVTLPYEDIMKSDTLTCEVKVFEWDRVIKTPALPVLLVRYAVNLPSFREQYATYLSKMTSRFCTVHTVERDYLVGADGEVVRDNAIICATFSRDGPCEECGKRTKNGRMTCLCWADEEDLAAMRR